MGKNGQYPLKGILLETVALLLTVNMNMTMEVVSDRAKDKES